MEQTVDVYLYGIVKRTWTRSREGDDVVTITEVRFLGLQVFRRSHTRPVTFGDNLAAAFNGLGKPNPGPTTAAEPKLF